MNQNENHFKITWDILPWYVKSGIIILHAFGALSILGLILF